jgi:hypothetical protein
MADKPEDKRVPDWYARDYWAWVDSEFERDDEWEFGAVEPGPMTEERAWTD